MGVIDRAILQDEIRQALNALFKSGQVGRKDTVTALQMVCHADHVDTALYDIGDFWPVAGKTYEVTVDGVTSTKTAEVYEIEGIRYTALGNMAIANIGDDTGEDWFIGVYSDVKLLMHRTKRYPETIDLTIKSETIHPIDQKFLPGVCLPVVELSTEIASGENVLTEAESAAINASFDYGLPLVIKFKTSVAGMPGVEASAILEYCSVPDFVTGYSAHITLATAAPGTLIVQKNESGDFVAIFTPDNA